MKRITTPTPIISYLANGNHSDYAVRLIRMSPNGRVLWDIPHKTVESIGGIAIGTTHFYYTYSDSSGDTRHFVARSVVNGSILCRSVTHLAPVDDPPYRLQLSRNEKWAVVGNRSDQIWILDTATGRTIYSFDTSPESWLVFSSREDKFWQINFQIRHSPLLCYEFIYKEKGDTFRRRPLWLHITLPQSPVGSLGFDGDRQQCFHVDRDTDDILAKVITASLIPRQPRKQKGLHRLIRTSKRFEECSDLIPVTLPVNLHRMGTDRRDLEFPMPWTIHDKVGAECGMLEDYLIVYDEKDETLVVVDFWPTW